MKRNVTEYDFIEAFREMGRQDSFSCEGLKALYEWFEEYEEGTGEEIELDVVGICCDFSEYDTAIEAAQDYGWEPEDGNDYEQEVSAMEWLSDRTTMIAFCGVEYLGGRNSTSGVIIQGF